MKKWKVVEVKVQLGKILKSLPDDGPQEITVRGVTKAVLMSVGDYEKLIKAVELKKTKG